MLTGRQLDEIAARADAVDVPALIAEIRKLHALVEAAYNLKDVRTKMNKNFMGYQEIRIALTEREAEFGAALTRLFEEQDYADTDSE